MRPLFMKTFPNSETQNECTIQDRHEHIKNELN